MTVRMLCSIDNAIAESGITLFRSGSVLGRERRRDPRQGAMLILIAIMLVGFMIAVAFSVDVAHMHLAKTELRTSTDAASKAAAATLSETLSEEAAIKRGQQIAALNPVHGEPLLLDPQDFLFGRSVENKAGRFEFALGQSPKNSVQVTGRRTSDSPSGPVPLFFGNIMGFRLFEPRCLAAATYIERDVVLVVDRSGSMEGEKFLDLVDAIDTFVATLGETPVNEHVGLASYSDYATSDVPLTENLDAISAGIRSLDVGGFTSISGGMRAGQEISNNSQRIEFVERTLIVMTDGLHNRGPEPSEVAIELAAEGVTIHTITFGADADKIRMQEVASIGGGRHYHAEDGTQLRQIYREIALTLSTMMTQ
jgi:uncharacterized protein YegL